jgi:spermidine synthase
VHRGPRTRLIVLLIFFLSGISGLVYQIVWTRMLVLVFGNTLLATSTVLSAFMAGLAAGSFALGEHIDRKPRRLLKVYAVLEAGIGIFGLVFPFLFTVVAPLYTTVYQSFGGNLAIANLVRFLVCFLLILLPTFCMGGTLPVLLKHVAERFGKLGYQVGFLYGLNTAGAVVGCVAAGYWLLGTMGLQRTTWIAVAINLGVAVIAWLLPEKKIEIGTTATLGRRRELSPTTGHRYPRPVVTAVLIGIALSGFCALAYEVLWVRMLNLFLNNNTFSFTATIATFLLGIAIGSLLFARFLSRLKAELSLFAGLQVAIGLMACATPFLFTLLQDPLFSKRTETLTILKTAVIMIGPTIMMGIAVPLAVQICQWGRGREGRSVGAVYAFNTIGSILGAFVAGFILIPSLGLHPALLTVASLNLGAGMLLLAAQTAAGRRLGLVAGWWAVVLLLFHTAPDALFREIYQRSAPRSEILHYKEGKVVNVVVYDFEAGYKDLHLNGIEEASSRLWHVQLFKLLGVLPTVVHDRPDEALMIAFGAGMSAGAAIRQVNSLEVVDLNPDISGPAEIFRRENLDVLDNPKLTFTVNDGRNTLLLNPKKYSVIISDATNPKMFDSWTMYTREFYELTKSRLLPGGVFAQWLVYPLPGDSFTSILRTFRSVYPHMSLWSIHGSSQCLMLGTPDRLDIDFTQFAKRLEPVLVSSKLAEYGVGSAPKFLSFFLLGEDELDEMLADAGPISTDDLPHPQFQYGGALEGIQECLDLLKHQNTILPYLRNLGAERREVEAELEAHRDISQHLNLGFFLKRWDEFMKAAHLARRHGFPDDANVASALRYDSERMRYHLERATRHPNDPEVHNSLGYVYWRRGDHERAIEHLTEATALSAGFANALANLAQVQMATGDLEGATRSLRQLRETKSASTMQAFLKGAERVLHLRRRLESEEHSFELYHELATAYVGIGDLLSAVDVAGKAEGLIDRDAPAFRKLAELYLGLEFTDEAAEAYRRAAELVPGDPHLAAAARFAGVLQGDAKQRQRWLHQRHLLIPESAGRADQR